MKGLIIMKKISRVLSVLLIAATTVGCFAGCAGNKTDSNGKNTLRVEIFERGDVPAGAGSITDNALTKWIKSEFEEENNVNVEFVSVPRGQEMTQLNVLMAAGEAPDIVVTYDRNLLLNFYEQGGLTDLTEYVKDAPNLTKFLGDDVLSYGQHKGEQFAIPSKRLIVGRMAQLIRQDWLDELGMEAPTTTEEFYAVLKAFKERDPECIPWGVSLHQPHFMDLVNSFVDYDSLSEQERGTILPPMLPNFKEGLRFMNKLYHEGLISPDFALDKDRKQMEAEFSNGKVGFVNDDLGRPLQTTGYGTVLLKNNPNAKLTAVDTFTDKNGNHPKEQYTPVGLYIAVPKSCKHPEIAIKYLDWMAQPDVLRTLQFGWEGQNYTIGEDGLPVIIDTDEAKKTHWYNLGFDTALIVNGKYAGDDEKSIAFNAKSCGDMAELYVECHENSVRDGWAPLVLPPSEEYNRYITGLTEKFTEMLVKSITASESEFDNVFDSLLAEYKSIGGDAVSEANARVYAESTEQ